MSDGEPLRPQRRATPTQRPAGSSTRDRLFASAGSWIALALGVLCAVFAVAQLLSDASGAPANAASLPVAMAPASSDAVAAAPVTVAAAPLAAPAVLAAPSLPVIEGELRRGDTLARALGRSEVGSSTVHQISTALSSVFDFRYARPGDRFRLRLDPEGELAAFAYERSERDVYRVYRKGDALVAEHQEPEVRVEEARIAGLIQTSLYDAVVALGERGELAHDFADVFAWDVDFSRDVHPGDEFAILYERRTLADTDPPVYLGPGRILAARYSNSETDYAAVYYETSKGEGGYYRGDGSSVRRQFLRAPLKFSRISSAFSTARLHPILNVRRPHLGIDYAAPTGTPVWSVADGTVVFRGWQGGFGNLVKIRHANGYVTSYGHLSRFPRGLSVGSRVQQMQVVGYVGATGLATGPHLDFRIQQNGRYINPAALHSPAGAPIPRDQLAGFFHTRDALFATLDPAALSVVTSDAL